jgi:hypothetical protein
MLALRLADLLEDHLLGGLGGDAAEHFRRLGKLHLVAELDAVRDVVAVQRPVHLAGFVERDFGRRRGDGLDDGLEREQVDLSGLEVEARLQVFAGLVVLAGCGRDGFFDRADDDVGLDALFLRQCFDRLL